MGHNGTDLPVCPSLSAPVFLNATQVALMFFECPHKRGVILIIWDRLLRRRTMSGKNKKTDVERTQHALLNTYGYIRWEAQGVYGRDSGRFTGHA